MISKLHFARLRLLNKLRDEDSWVWEAGSSTVNNNNILRHQGPVV